MSAFTFNWNLTEILGDVHKAELAIQAEQTRLAKLATQAELAKHDDLSMHKRIYAICENPLKSHTSGRPPLHPANKSLPQSFVVANFFSENNLKPVTTQLSITDSYTTFDDSKKRRPENQDPESQDPENQDPESRLKNTHGYISYRSDGGRDFNGRDGTIHRD